MERFPSARFSLTLANQKEIPLPPLSQPFFVLGLIGKSHLLLIKTAVAAASTVISLEVQGSILTRQ